MATEQVGESPLRRARYRERLRRLTGIIGGVGLSVLSPMLPLPPLCAQGVSSGGIIGIVRTQLGAVDGARVEVLNRGSGYSVTTTTRGGRFIVLGIEVGGPYVVTVRRLGFAPASRDSIYVSLGEPRSLDFVLEPAAQALDRVHVMERGAALSRSHTGTSTTISDSLLHRLPTLNRDMYDFVRLVPQVSTRFSGVSGGVSFRLNSYLIDGVSDRQLGSNSVMGGTRGGKSMPLDALKEYEVLLSPYDARYGDFAGLVVNAVTKSGTNELHGSAFGYLRNEHLARGSGFLGGSSYEREQYGFTLGGPIVRDRLQFFIAPEFQHHAEPAPGPYVGQAPNASSPVPVSATDVDRFAAILRARGIEPGNGGRVTSLNPVTAFFGRLDVALPEWRSRIVLRHTYSEVERTQFARSATGRFALSSNAYALRFTKRTGALQLFTQPTAHVFNELLVAASSIPVGPIGYTYSPTVQVLVPSTTGPGTSMMVAGPPDAAQATDLVNASVEIADHLAVQVSERHRLSVGMRGEWFRYYGPAVSGNFGRWTFWSLDSLVRGEAANYVVSRDFGAAAASLDGTQLSPYINDEWRAGDRLTVTAGLRAEILTFDGRPEYNAAIDSVFGRRTSDFPERFVAWSPRVGFSWAISADGRTRVRGGAGVFAGRPPLGWLRSPLREYGTGIRTLTCRAAFGVKVVPEFSADPGSQPNACANGRPFTSGAVDLVDHHLRMAEGTRASLAVDRELPWQVVATGEVLYTKSRSDFLLDNLNLRGPQGVDRHGRVMYGTLGSLGARPALVVDSLPEVIDLRNQSHNHSWSVTGQLTKKFTDRLEARASYTYSALRDVQSLTENSAGNPVFDSWAAARAVSGRLDDLSPGVSSFDLPHRVVLAATYTAPWRRWATDVSIYYVGESGVRFTYLDSSATAGFGDLNADGTSANDPIYVPRNTADTSEIVFDARAGDAALQQAAFERFIQGSPCLRRQRGRIVERNSCIAPWVHTSELSLRQALPAVWRHRLTLQVDAFNVLNLLNARWGLLRVPNVNVLEHVAQMPGAPAISQSVFRFNPSLTRYSTANAESSYQLQLAARYSF
jgi:hypothetical protein